MNAVIRHLIAIFPFLLLASACGDAIYIKGESSYDFIVDWWLVGTVAGLIGAVLLTLIALRAWKFISGGGGVTVRVFGRSDIVSSVDSDAGVVGDSQSGAEADANVDSDAGVVGEKVGPPWWKTAYSQVQKFYPYIFVAILVAFGMTVTDCNLLGS